jgi:hypothetical protein
VDKVPTYKFCGHFLKFYVTSVPAVLLRKSEAAGTVCSVAKNLMFSVASFTDAEAGEDAV